MTNEKKPVTYDRLGKFGKQEYERYRQRGATHEQAVELAYIATDGTGWRELKAAKRRVLGETVT